MNKLQLLQDHLETIGPVAVAVSGGVDSMTLAYVAHKVNPATQQFHAISPAVPIQATQRVKRYAEQQNWNLNLVNADEIQDPNYVANPANRCYYCKTNLYDTIVTYTDLQVISGTNVDDLGDYRPGLIAAEEHQVLHPYVDVGIDKQTLRKIAQSLGLNDLHDLPAAPCLSSRVTTGIAINAKLLPVINAVEQALWQQLKSHLTLAGVRCRIRLEQVVIELDTEEAIQPNSDYASQAIQTAENLFRSNGFETHCDSITLEPYRRGSAFLIETLQVEH
jgi:uncharacterized protein